MSKKSYYYTSGHTSKGYISFLSSNISDPMKVIVLKHQSHTLKSNVLKQVIRDFELTDSLEIIYSAFGNTLIDGVIIRGKSLAIVSDVIVDEGLCRVEEVDLTNTFPNRVDEQELSIVAKGMATQCQLAYDEFRIGLQIHDHLESIYIAEMNFKKADLLAEKFITNLLKNVPPKQRVTFLPHRFFGTNTAQGSVNIVPEITEKLAKRVFIKGRSGTGKSVFMKKVAVACENHGFDVARYHCSFDPDSIDMIVVPSLDFCIFDSTDPHEYFPEREGDIVVDLYKETVTPGTDEKYAREIKDIKIRYKSYLRNGMNYLRSAKCLQDKVETKYKNIDQTAFQSVTSSIYKHVP